MYNGSEKFKKEGEEHSRTEAVDIPFPAIYTRDDFYEKNKIQALKIRESFFQRKRELATVETHLKSGLAGFGGQLTDVSQHDSEEIQQWYSNH